MKRPQVVHFTAIETQEQLAIRASLSLSVGNKEELTNPSAINQELPRTPWDSMNLLLGHFFRLRILAYNQNHNLVLEKNLDSDRFGNFDFKIQKQKQESIHRLQVFEIGHNPGLHLLMGHFIPKHIPSPKKIVISDFDRTLVDTRYHTTKEIYHSLTRPLKEFPSIAPSIERLQSFIAKGLTPFILTASPHFYEEAIRDWLNQNQIFNAEIFLKDYRKILSPWNTIFRTKDLKAQGFYKLNHLVNILLMTGIPEELVLMGDGFESDTLIYLALACILFRSYDPRSLWKILKDDESFRLNQQQDSHLLSKIHQLDTLLYQNKNFRPKIQILIRCRPPQKEVNISIKELRPILPLVEFYSA